MSNPLQKSDDEYFKNQPGSGAGVAETLIENDSPNVVPEVNTGNAKEKTIEPIEKGSRDDSYTEEHDKDKNLRDQFIQK